MSCQENPPVATVVNGKEAIKVVRDEIEDSPRENSNLGVISMRSGGAYDGLGEETYFLPGCADESDEPGKCGADLFKGTLACIPLYVDDWSWKLVIRTDANHPDEVPDGYIYATGKAAAAMGITGRNGRPPAQAVRRDLLSEIAGYNQFLADEVYAARHVRAGKCDMGHDHEDVVESVHGIYPSYDGNIDEDGRCAWRMPDVLAANNHPADDVVRQYIDDFIGGPDDKDARGWYAAAAECMDLSSEARAYWSRRLGRPAGPPAGGGSGGGGGDGRRGTGAR